MSCEKGTCTDPRNRRTVKAQASLHIRVVSPELLLFAHTIIGNKGNLKEDTVWWVRMRNRRITKRTNTKIPCLVLRLMYWKTKLTRPRMCSICDPRLPHNNTQSCLTGLALGRWSRRTDHSWASLRWNILWALKIYHNSCINERVTWLHVLSCQASCQPELRWYILIGILGKMLV